MNANEQGKNDEISRIIRKALRKAYNYGQAYWQQADSESYSEQAKSDVTAKEFATFVEQTVTVDAIAQLCAKPDNAEPLTEEQILSMWQQSYDEALKDGGFYIGNSDFPFMNQPIVFARKLLAAPLNIAQQAPTDSDDEIV